MEDYALVPVDKDETFVKQLQDFLSSADGSAFNICAGLYEIILKADKEDRPYLFQKAIDLYEDIDSDKSVPVSALPYETQKKALQEKYGDIVDSFIAFFTAQKYTVEVFYKNMWESIQNDAFFPDDAAKIFACYYVIIDKRVPYFALDQGYEMSNESYRGLRKKHSALLKKIRYILNVELDQKTERASLLLKEIGIAMPDGEAGVEIVNEYEKKLIAMVEILNVLNQQGASLDAFMKQMQGRLPD